MQARWLCQLLAIAALWGGAEVVRGESDLGTASSDFADWEIEALSEVQISSLGRKRTSVFTSASSATVVTSKDIEASGALDLSAALSQVPGLQASRADSHTLILTARGFADATANKMLALSDGRTLYDPLRSGAQWGYEAPFLADVLRIEVLRGPGASLWGSNAMNGVVNIVSKSAHETLGGYLSAGVGNELDFFGAIRQGFKLSPRTAVRLYGQHQQRDETDTSGRPPHLWTHGLLGARLDYERGDGAVLTVISEYREARSRRTVLLPLREPPFGVRQPDLRDNRGSFIMSRWEQPLGTETDLKVQASADRVLIDEWVSGGRRTSWEFDSTVTHRWLAHEMMAGLSFREHYGRARFSPWFSFRDDRFVRRFLGFFLQDEITLIPKRFTLGVGAKWERNSYTGWEFQPSLRFAWTPSPRHTVWAAVSRAVRTPSTTERLVTLFAGTVPPQLASPWPTAVTVVANDTLDAEELVAFEVGYRQKLTPRLLVDASFYLNDYHRLRGIESARLRPPTSPSATAELEARVGNTLEGQTVGGEALLQWTPAPRWEVNVSTSWIHADMNERVTASFPISSLAQVLGDTAKFEHKLSLSAPVAQRGTFGFSLRRTGPFESSQLSSYWSLDARFAWRWDDRWTSEIGGRDLTDPLHREMAQSLLTFGSREIGRTVYVRLTYRF